MTPPSRDRGEGQFGSTVSREGKRHRSENEFRVRSTSMVQRDMKRDRSLSALN
jgi:hypothetical protein